jgi:hypothetical protein
MRICGQQKPKMWVLIWSLNMPRKLITTASLATSA